MLFAQNTDGWAQLVLGGGALAALAAFTRTLVLRIIKMSKEQSAVIERNTGVIEHNTSSHDSLRESNANLIKAVNQFSEKAQECRDASKELRDSVEDKFVYRPQEG